MPSSTVTPHLILTLATLALLTGCSASLSPSGTATLPAAAAPATTSPSTSTTSTSATTPPATTTATTPTTTSTPAAPTSTTPATAPHVLTGRVHGGQQPVVGSSLQLFAAGTSGYGSAATPLLTSSVITAADGSFNLTGTYTCPSANTQVYLTATGGDAGAGINPATVLLAALGPCGSLFSVSYITVNEVSTVAAAYALGQFMAPGSSSIGTSPGNALGLANAFLTVPNLVDLATGNARSVTPSGNGTAPQRTLNALANILAACVNSTGASGPCPTLFSSAHAVNDPAPADTLSAARNISLNPSLNIAALYAIAGGSPPFQPALTAVPNDWTVTVAYTGGGLAAPGFPAVDATGNLWVPNAGATILSAFSPTGTPLAASGFTGGGIAQSVAAAVDLNGSVWVSNAGPGSLSRFSGSGAPLSPSSGLLPGTGAFDTLAVDGNGMIYASQGVNNTVYKLNSSGGTVATLTGGGLSGNWGLAVDASGNLWATDHASAAVSRFSPSGVPASTSGYSGGGLFHPFGAAVDANGNLWVADRFTSVTEFNSAGSPINSAGFALAADTESIAVDGADTVWTANSDGGVSHLSAIGNAISPANGFQPGGSAGKGIALDSSGNVWTTDTANQVFQIIGAAAPVATPLAQAVHTNTLGTRP